MTNITLHEGDNRDSLRRLIDQGVRVHSVVTDPPYGLVSTAKRFGKEGSAAAKSNGATGVFKRASGGFMGKQWDASGIERDPEFWALIHDILLPGGYVLAFSSPRTGHWQACAMEMAGFIMHPFFGWVYGSGFPKAHNAAGAIDRHLGHGNRGSAIAAASSVHPTTGKPLRSGDNLEPYEARSPEAAQWEGWAYGAQSMKPALEPVYFGQKPFTEKNGALNLLKHGVGAVNIDGCRVACEDGGRPLREVAPMRDDVEYAGNSLTGRVDGSLQSSKAVGTTTTGRHPANLIHDDSDEVRAMFPKNKSGVAVQRNGGGQKIGGGESGIYNGSEGLTRPDVGYGDEDSAARFFNGFPFEADPLFYHAKASKADRAGSKHPTVKPVALMQHFVRLVTPPGGVVLDPFGGSGTTAEAARREGFDCILMEADEQYVSDIRSRFSLPTDSEDNDSFDSMFG